jgi:hypothetical protein
MAATASYLSLGLLLHNAPFPFLDPFPQYDAAHLLKRYEVSF